MIDPASIAHIIVAAGSGSRFGSALPKQFCELDGRPVLMHTVDRFRKASCGGDIVLVLSPSMRGLWAGMCERHGYVSPAVVDGADTRWGSVRNALRYLSQRPLKVITVHDGARPLVSDEVICRAVEAVACGGAAGAIPCIPVTDSLRRVGGDAPAGGAAVDRSAYRAVQTPQAFDASLLQKAYSMPFSPLFTDDASVMEAAGAGPLLLTEGSASNIKITHPCDLAVASALLAFARRQ